jgi:pyrroline-5-carboxylate reductase
MDKVKVGFIGFGNMGRAIAAGLLRKKLLSKEDILVSVKSSQHKEKLQKEGFNVLSPEEIVEKSSVVFLAVKPFAVKDVLNLIKDRFNSEKLLITVVAGLPISFYEEILGKDKKIVRTMPNVNVAVGKGLWGVSYNPNIGEEDRSLVRRLLEATGRVFEIDENFIDAFTALAGSGPAFVAEIIDAFTLGGVKLGFSRKEALEIALETFLGTITYLQRKNIHPIQFRDTITSPAGTTIYGISKLNSLGIKGALIEVIEEAYKRSKELGK